MLNRILLTAITISTLFISSCVKNEYYTVEPDPQTQVPQYNFVFDDNFDNNINNWAFSDPANSAYVSIGSSRLKYSYLPPTDGTNTVAINTGAKLHRNFLVQTRIKTDYAMGITFGVSDNNYGFSFFIDNEGYFALYKEGDAKTAVQTILDWQYSEAIYKEGWNDLELEQVGNDWMGYVNGVKVFQVPSQYLAGDKIGYIVLAGTTGYADYLTVQW
ncbi:MAG: hypothetical protein H6551_05250 [Chitinophagales bacterium]|nr:hypothetical protein [Chitinophagaceae bacterium]MCB9064535.1 hypothetical protein [Chitinophagales bacterium]